jgi:hypothetical protein
MHHGPYLMRAKNSQWLYVCNYSAHYLFSYVIPAKAGI